MYERLKARIEAAARPRPPAAELQQALHFFTKHLFNKAQLHVGRVLADPSHGSDAGVIRDEDGFHLIYEDCDPINARQNSWDSQSLFDRYSHCAARARRRM